jgi:beta-glucosidase
MAPAWSFGPGLGYSTIDYVSAKIDKATYVLGEFIHVSVTLKNSGKYDADEIIQIYVQDLYASVTWVEQLLKQFKRQHVKAGETVTIDLIVNTHDLWVINNEEKRVVESGAFELRVSKSSIDHKFRIPFAIE